jgi:tetratricopeptide (TPR) repeat protein
MFARGYLGVSYAFSGNYDAALLHLEEAIRLSPLDPLLIIWHLCKGWAALLTQRYAEAIRFTGLAAEANPEFPDIYAVLAAANGQLGRVGAAQAALNQLSRRMPDLTTNDERLNRPLEREEYRALFLEGLRKAGMPE